VFGCVTGDIDAHFCEDLDGFGVDISRGLGSGAVDFEQISGGVAEDAFGHVAAAGVAGAKNEDTVGLHPMSKEIGYHLAIPTWG
jgi:hypothetical protein